MSYERIVAYSSLSRFFAQNKLSSVSLLPNPLGGTDQVLTPVLLGQSKIGRQVRRIQALKHMETRHALIFLAAFPCVQSERFRTRRANVRQHHERTPPHVFVRIISKG